MTTTIPEDASYQATLEQIAELRELVAEPTEDTFSNAALGTLIDAAGGSIDAAALAVWKRKAASFSGLVDVREGNSDRKLSQLYKQALDMVDRYEARVLVSGKAKRGARTRKIERQ